MDIIDSVSSAVSGVASAISEWVPGGVGDLLITGALATMDQGDRPIMLMTMVDGFPAWAHWMVPRPEDMTYSHPTRSSAINTIGGAYVDDFGTGIADITVRGNTGYKMEIVDAMTGGTFKSGEMLFLNLRDFVVGRYHELRYARAQAGQDPDGIELLLVDTLNTAVWVCYPRSFQLQRTRQSPFLYRYTLQLWGLEKLL